ncbi:MAG: alpha/beta fold hydrolase [Hamadaea sp.]|nr:alpha/beta fold hydrolase [Hamadaea sp.]
MTDVLRLAEWAHPVTPVRREVLTATPEVDEGRPPVLFVPGFGHGAWAYAEHWLEHAASRGFPSYAMSMRGHGASEGGPLAVPSGAAGPSGATVPGGSKGASGAAKKGAPVSAVAKKAGLRAYAHDVVQVAASLPRRTVLIGHGAGALVVSHALARYPARAAVLVAPVLGGVGAALRNPGLVLPALFGGGLRLPAGQLFSRELPAATAKAYARRMGRASTRAQWQLLRGRTPAKPVGDPPVLVVGSPDDRIVSPAALKDAARAYGGAPLLFPGMGHDMMLDARWREPIDAILDWLEKSH